MVIGRSSYNRISSFLLEKSFVMSSSLSLGSVQQQLATQSRRSLHEYSQRSLARVMDATDKPELVAKIADTFTAKLEDELNNNVGMPVWKTGIQSASSALSGSGLIGVTHDLKSLSSAKKIALMVATQAFTNPVLADAVSQGAHLDRLAADEVANSAADCVGKLGQGATEFSRSSITVLERLLGSSNDVAALDAKTELSELSQELNPKAEAESLDVVDQMLAWDSIASKL